MMGAWLGSQVGDGPRPWGYTGGGATGGIHVGVADSGVSGAFNGRSLSADIVDSSETGAGKAVVTATDAEIRQRVSELDSEVSGDRF